METKIFSIKGMGCSGCVDTVQTALEALEGVENVQVDLESASATLSGSSQSINDKQVIEAVHSAGYEVVQS